MGAGHPEADCPPLTEVEPEVEAHRLIARRALSFLGRGGARDANGMLSAQGEVAGLRLSVALTGPGLPDDVPPALASPAQVRDTIAWGGTYLLVIRAPRNVFEIAWNLDDPVRIMAFSRGDWEDALAQLAVRSEAAR